MSVLRLFAMMVIFGAVSMAWFVLGTSMWVRTEMLDDSLSAEVASLIGPVVVRQNAPYWSAQTGGRADSADALPPDASEIDVRITHEDRYKGLLWYNRTAVTFSGKYTLSAQAGGVGAKTGGFFIFHLPGGITSHDGLAVTLDGEPVELPQQQKQSGDLAVSVARDVEHVVTVSYSTQGQDVWLYAPGRSNGSGGYHRWDSDSTVPAGAEMSELKNFSMTVAMNFADVDYPKGTQSPSGKRTLDDGFEGTWQYQSLVTNQAMGVVMPKRTNAGPIAARMSFFAPISLLFFFTVLFGVVVLKKIPLHPMHMLLISAGFFAFHILLAYLADQVNIHAAFWICAVVSVFLVVSYMRLVVGVKFALTYVAVAQLVYLVGFSYAFFWVGKTGLTVTIGAIATLFVLMQATGKLDWSEVFSRRKNHVVPPGPGGAAPGNDDPLSPPPITPGLKPPTS